GRELQFDAVDDLVYQLVHRIDTGSLVQFGARQAEQTTGHEQEFGHHVVGNGEEQEVVDGSVSGKIPGYRIQSNGVDRHEVQRLPVHWGVNLLDMIAGNT